MIVHMKVGLVFPNIKDNRVIYYSSVHQPTGLAYLASALEKSGVEVKIFDLTAENASLDTLKGLIQSFNPDLIGITTNVAIARKACITGRYIKRVFPQVKVIFGGPWASTNAGYVLNSRICDVVVIGEGEETIVELCKIIEIGGDFHQIKGIAFKENMNNIIFTEQRPFIDNLDALPFPAWHLFPDPKKYMHFNRYFPFFPVLATRGCVYNCIHCTKFIHGYKIRQRSVENVIEELKLLKSKYGAKEILIIDDNFTMNRKFCTNLLKEIIKNNLNLKINFANGVRADTLTPGLVRLMKEAGTYSIALGVESGNDKILQMIGKNTTRAKIEKAAYLIKKSGIFLRTFFILGLPGDSNASMNETIEFARKLDAEYAHFFIANPFPGTRMHEMLKEKHPNSCYLFSDFYNKVNEKNFVGFVPWNAVNYYHKRAYVLYYARPSKILSLLSKSRTLQDIKWMFNFVGLFIGTLIDGRGLKKGLKRK